MARPPQHWSKHVTAKRFDVLHHFLAAAMLATLTLVLEHFGALDWLDAAMLRLARVENTVLTLPPTGPAPPHTVLIDAKTYAERFHLQSPLSRERLTPILEDIFAAHPKALLIDLQLEPTWGESTLRPLDSLLTKMAASGQTQRTAVLLPIPVSRTTELDVQSLRWMRQMCDAGIEFGSAQIREHFGVAVRYDKTPQTLAAMLARHKPATGDMHTPHSSDHAQTTLKVDTVCQLAQITNSLTKLRASIQPASVALNRTAPLSPKSVAIANAAQQPWEERTTRETLRTAMPELVVLGGAYEESDTFYVFGESKAVSGAVLHAAIAEGWGDVHNLHAPAWWFDALFGTVLGLILQFLWSLLPGRLEHTWNWRALTLTNLHTAAIWMVVAIFMCLLSAGLFQFSTYLIQMGYWMNPGPVVVGMCIHALLLASNPKHSSLGSLRDFFAHHPACGLQLLLLIATVLYLPFMH